MRWNIRGSVPSSGSQIDVSVDGGPLVPLTQTSHTSFKFQGSAGHTYGFAVQTQDIGGLTSATPTAPKVTVLTACPPRPSKRISCARLLKGKWAGLTVPGHPASKLNIAVRGGSTANEAMVVEKTPCPANGLMSAVCFHFTAFNTETGIQVTSLGESLAFTGAKPVYVYTKGGRFAKLRRSSKSKPLAVGSRTYMWVP